MNLKSKSILIASQIFVILAFFTGMLMNYFVLFPIIDEGEGARLAAEIDNFCSELYLNGNNDIYDRKQMDSLMKLDPYGCGDLLIMDGDARIIYSRNGESGDGYSCIEAKYGTKATNLLKSEQSSSDRMSRMDYDRKNHISLYAGHRPKRNLLFFYAIDYRIPGKDLYTRFGYLLLFMVIGGIILVLISTLIIKRINSQVRDKIQIRHELETAALIQKSMLPKEEKQLIQLDVNARLVPAKTVGGDFFCHILRDGLLYFCIGDVSGKGVPASLFMSKAVTLFRCSVNSKMSTVGIAENMNRELCLNNEQNMFLTAVIGTIRVYDGMVTYVNAGHEPPVIWDGKADSSLKYLVSKGSVPLGIMAGVEFEEEQYQIEKNGLLLLYTDGISEARNKRHRMFGREKILQLLEDVKSQSSKEINNSLLKFISQYESGIEQSDDITLLTFRNNVNPKILTLKNEVAQLRKLVPFMEEIFKECLMDKKDHILIRSGLDEALTNCVLYAYKRPGKEIKVTASVEDSDLCFEIKDRGIPFNPLEYRPAASEELKVGGLGISIYKANFDEVQYCRKDGYNTLKLIKHL